MRSRFAVLFALVATLPVPVRAQTGGQAGSPAGPESAMFRLGPVGLSPSLALTNAGVDTNVFNEAGNPTRDVTATFVPGLDSVMRAGRALLSGRTSAEFVYFNRARHQRSSGFSQEGRIEILFARLTPFVRAGRLTSYQRPNAEIDARVRHLATFVGAGASIDLGSRVTLEVEGAKRQSDFADGTTEGAGVARSLNRRGDFARLSTAVALTPLTTFRLTGESLQERFDQSSFRDTNSITGLAGFEFKPFALISGSAMLGVRHTASKSRELPDFTGMVAAVDVGYVLREMTRIDFGLDRSVEASIESDQPYYVATGGRLSVTQAIGARWDVVARAARQTLDYRNRTSSAPIDFTARRDRSELLGLGIGFRIRPDLRIGFDANHARRRSVVEERSYEGYRFGGSVTYGRH